jgi:hypothetical protein
MFCALVIKDKLAEGVAQIPDVKFCWADDFDDAAKIFKNANWPQAFWVKNKSVCRVIKLFEVFSDEFYETIAEEDTDSMLNAEMLRSLPMEQKGSKAVEVEERPAPRRRRRRAA